MSIQNGCVLTHEGIEYLCGLIRDINGLDTNLIDDLNIKSNGSYSSLKISQLVDQALKDSKEYSDLLCSSLIKLTCEKTTVQPTLSNSQLNVIYLYSSDGNAPFHQYLKISDTELIDMGSTSISLNDYLTITDAVATYCKKTDFDTLKTEVTNIKTKVGTDTLNTTSQDLSGGVNELKTDLTSHTNDTDIHVTTSDKTKWNKVDNKADKTSILTAISASPSDSNLLSEKAIKSELDKKSNNTDLNNFKQGTLVTQTSMNKNILLWDVGHYYFDANLIWQSYEHIPNTTYAPHVYVTSVKPIKYKDIDLNSTNTNAKSWFRQIKVEDHLGSSFIRTIYTPNVKDVVDLENGKLLSSGSDTGWQRVSTSVADKRYTAISASNITNATLTTSGTLSYSIKNGICYIRINGLLLSGKGRVTIPTGTFPKPDSSITNGHFPVIDDNNNCYLTVISSSGDLIIKCGTETGVIYTTISYPVAEEQKN